MNSRKNRFISGLLSFVMMFTLVMQVLPPIKVNAADPELDTPKMTSPSISKSWNSSGFYTGKRTSAVDCSDGLELEWTDVGADYYNINMIILSGDPNPGTSESREYQILTNEHVYDTYLYVDAEEFEDYPDYWVKIAIQPMLDGGDSSNGGYGYMGMYYFLIDEFDVYFELSEDYFEFDADGGKDTFYVYADSSYTLEVTEGEDWLSLSSSSGSADKKITITCDENTTVDEREGEIEIYHKSSGNYLYVDVWQEGYDLEPSSTFPNTTETMVIGQTYEFTGTATAEGADIDIVHVNIQGPDTQTVGVSYYRETDIADDTYDYSDIDSFVWGDTLKSCETSATMSTNEPGKYWIIVYTKDEYGGTSERTHIINLRYPEQVLDTPELYNPDISSTWSSNGYYTGQYSGTIPCNEDVELEWDDVDADYYRLDIIVLSGSPDPASSSESRVHEIEIDYHTENTYYTIDAADLEDYAGKWVKVCVQPYLDNGDYGYRGLYYFKLEDVVQQVPEVIDVSWNVSSIIEDTNVTYTITTGGNVDTVKFSVDSYLLDTITSYTTSGNNRIFKTTQAIQSPGTRKINIVAYAGSVVSDTYTETIVVEEAELEQLKTVKITSPSNGFVHTEGDSLEIKWSTPSNVSSVDRYIVKIWSDIADEYTYTKTVYGNSVTVGSYYIQDIGNYSISITAIKSGYESSETTTYFSVEEGEKTLQIPTITAPNSYGMYDAGKDLTFSWNKVNGATKYYYDIRDITDGEPGVTIFSGSTQNRSVTVPGDVLLAGHVIYLYVYAWSSEAESEEAFACAVIVKSDVSINTSTEELDFGSTADYETITLTSSNSWTATPSENWITLNKYSGSSTSQIKISVAKNTTDKIRWGYVEFEDSTGSVIVEVYQATSTSAYIDVDTTTVRLDASRGYSDDISITANVSWRITSDSDWLFTSRSSGTYDHDIYLIVEANDSEKSRTGKITISSGSMSETITVVQEGGAAPTISNFKTSYTTELGNDVPLQGIVKAVGTGKLNKVTIKCNNSGGTENTVATVDLKLENTNTFNLADLKFATTNSNIFNGAGTYTFIVYASADNFTVTNNMIGSFTVTVTKTTALPSVADKGLMNLKATSVTLMAAIENYGSGTFEKCGFDLYDANGNWIKSYTQKRPTNNSNSFQSKVTGLEPETTYYYCPFVVTSEGTFPATDNRSLIEFITSKATPIQGVELLDGNENVITTSNIYGTIGDTLNFGVKTTNGSGDIKSISWLTPNSKIYSIKSSSTKECTIILSEPGLDNFSVTVTDYYGNEYCVAVYVNVYEEEYTYKLKYSDSLSSEDSRTYNYYNMNFDTRYFNNPSTMYNHDLAKLSMGFVLAAQSSYALKTESGIAAENKRTEAIQGVYDAFGFENVEYHNYDLSLLNCDDKIAYSFATKEILTNDTAYTLVAFITRGGNYGGEWVSNFNVGNGMSHIGFTYAASQAYNEFITYCENKKIDLGGNVKVLITGFSRSAAVSNVIARYVNSAFTSHGNSNENVYAYTFATPNNTQVNGNPDTLSNGNENIFNIVTKDDFVPYVPMTTWGFGKYGTTLLLPQYGTLESYNMLNVLEDLITIGNIYDEVNGISFQDWGDQSDAAKQMSILLRYTFGSLDEFDSNYQSLVTKVATEHFGTEDGIDIGEKIKGILLYYASKAVIKQAGNKLTGLPVGTMLSLVMGYSVEFINPDLPQFKKLISDMVDSFMNLSERNQNLIIEFLTGMDIDTFIEFLLAADAAIWYGGEYLDMFVDIYIPMLQPAGHIASTHRMETYLAWLESADAKTLFNNSFDMYNISVACPVNINIYDEDDVLVGRVVNDEIDTSFDLADSIELNITDDVKSISIYDNGYYRFEIIPISEGNMTISINGTSAVNSGIYENVALSIDSEYQLIPILTSSGNISYELIDAKLDMYQISEINNDILIMIKSKSDGNGHSVGGGMVAYNEYITMTAIPHGNDTFIGWYLNDELVSSDPTYSFFATQSQSYTARFTGTEEGNTETVTISGTITSYGDADEAVTVILYDADGTVIDSDATTDGTYTLSAPDGTYTLEVSKLNHVTREYEVTVDGDDVTQDVKIHLIGDTTQDGKVNMKDWNRLYEHVIGESTLSGYAWNCADVNQDKKVNMKDWNRLYDHVIGTNSLWS